MRLSCCSPPPPTTTSPPASSPSPIRCGCRGRSLHPLSPSLPPSSTPDRARLRLDRVVLVAARCSFVGRGSSLSRCLTSGCPAAAAVAAPVVLHPRRLPPLGKERVALPLHAAGRLAASERAPLSPPWVAVWAGRTLLSLLDDWTISACEAAPGPARRRRCSSCGRRLAVRAAGHRRSRCLSCELRVVIERRSTLRDRDHHPTTSTSDSLLHPSSSCCCRRWCCCAMAAWRCRAAAASYSPGQCGHGGLTSHGSTPAQPAHSRLGRSPLAHPSDNFALSLPPLLRLSWPQHLHGSIPA